MFLGERGGAGAANLRKRGGGKSRGAAQKMLENYTDETNRLWIAPSTVLIMSIGFIASVVMLHVIGKLYLHRGDA